eukprot:2392642-Rhodomonas_salina.1
MMILSLSPSALALRCYEDASLSNVTSADVTVEFQSTPWRSTTSFPDGLQQMPRSNLSGYEDNKHRVWMSEKTREICGCGCVDLRGGNGEQCGH